MRAWLLLAVAGEDRAIRAGLGAARMEVKATRELAEAVMALAAPIRVLRVARTVGLEVAMALAVRGEAGACRRCQAFGRTCTLAAVVT